MQELEHPGIQRKWTSKLGFCWSLFRNSIWHQWIPPFSRRNTKRVDCLLHPFGCNASVLGGESIHHNQTSRALGHGLSASQASEAPCCIPASNKSASVTRVQECSVSLDKDKLIGSDREPSTHSSLSSSKCQEQELHALTLCCIDLSTGGKIKMST